MSEHETATVIASAWNYLRFVNGVDPRAAAPSTMLHASYFVQIENQRGTCDTTLMRWWRQADFGAMRRVAQAWQVFIRHCDNPDAVWYPTDVAHALDNDDDDDEQLQIERDRLCEHEWRQEELDTQQCTTCGATRYALDDTWED